MSNLMGRGVKKIAVSTALSVAATVGVETSAAFSGVAGGVNMSLYVKLTGANGGVKVEILCSQDGTSFVVPETGGTILASITDELLHIKAISIPLTIFFKLRFTNTGAGTVTVDATVLSQ